jgi:hypothetical protein
LIPFLELLKFSISCLPAFLIHRRGFSEVKIRIGKNASNEVCVAARGATNPRISIFNFKLRSFWPRNEFRELMHESANPLFLQRLAKFQPFCSISTAWPEPVQPLVADALLRVDEIDPCGKVWRFRLSVSYADARLDCVPETATPPSRSLVGANHVR